jgi:uncharacterized protein YbjT (DUF2867 family)
MLCLFFESTSIKIGRKGAMSAATILVTGAAGGRQGSTGNHIARMLLECDRPVRAFVHRLDERSDRLQALGADVVQGDLLDLRSVRAAMAGVERAFFSYPVKDGLLEATATFATAAREAGCKLVVNLSQLLTRPDGQPTPHQQRHWLSEKVFDWAQIGAVHLNATVFYENLRALASGSLAKAGVVALPWGPASTPIPMVCAQDVARVATALLTGPPMLPGTVVPLVGTVVTNQEIVDAFSALLGRPVPYVEISDEQWVQNISGAGLNDIAVEHLVALWRFLRTRTPDHGHSHPTDTIDQIGGSEPISLVEFLAAERTAFSAAA